ncbi:sensor histidine kinase [Polluticaenibacter yanchengensis]|uniref:histidine kinase n=1 Tax=Polluticaenibacter yanchengensis TaxID=3014562 RepID=A0ABT4UFX3_9BACT|nr:sensor histidine kinase [Chitinophagaceae bacterium LY-5]
MAMINREETIWMAIIAAIIISVVYLYRKSRKNRKKRELRIALEAQEREKERLAKDLHDYFGARLSTLKLYMQTINRYDAKRIETMTGAAMQMIDSTIIELRHLLFDLNPKQLHKGKLIEALTELVRNIKDILKTNIETDFTEYTYHLPYSAETSVYRIIQELLNNTLKHAQATEILIKLKQQKKGLLLFYRDNGVGFDQETVDYGYGIRNIRQHTLAIDGQLHISTNINEGFECIIILPLK